MPKWRRPSKGREAPGSTPKAANRSCLVRLRKAPLTSVQAANASTACTVRPALDVDVVTFRHENPPRQK